MMNLHKRLERAKRAAELLNLDLLRELDSYVHRLIEELEAAQERKIPVQTGREIVEEKRVGSWTYRLERVRCGKANCKCAKGQGHGPYWYAYRWNQGRTISKYIGKTLKAG